MKKYYIPPQIEKTADIAVNEITNISEHPNTGLFYLEVNGVSKFYTDKANIYDETQLKQLMTERASDLKRRIDQRLRHFIKRLDNG